MEIKSREEIMNDIYSIFADDHHRQYGETKEFIDNLLTRFEEEDDLLKYLISVHSSVFAKLRNQNSKLKKALSFYADTTNWYPSYDDYQEVNSFDVVADNDLGDITTTKSDLDMKIPCEVAGKLARKVLKEIEEESKPKRSK